jgi:hypothetical protein
MRQAAEVISIRELAEADVPQADAVLPLSRLDTAQTYLVVWRHTNAGMSA